MKIRGLARDPVDESRDVGMGAQPIGLGIEPRQPGVADRYMDGAVTDRMDRHRLPPAPALGHRMMPLDSPSQRSPAQPAGLRPAHLWAKAEGREGMLLSQEGISTFQPVEEEKEW